MLGIGLCQGKFVNVTGILLLYQEISFSNQFLYIYIYHVKVIRSCEIYVLTMTIIVSI